MDDTAGVSIEDYLTIFRRRRFAMAWVALGVLTLAVVVTTFMPERYRSAATILIEDPEVRGEYVRTTVQIASTDLRIDRMRDRVVKRENLEPIIEEFSLYPDEDPEDRPGLLRSNIDIQKIINSNDPRAQLTGLGDTVGFQVIFTADTPEAAQGSGESPGRAVRHGKHEEPHRIGDADLELSRAARPTLSRLN